LREEEEDETAASVIAEELGYELAARARSRSRKIKS
jgi:hypothetical protein